MTAEARTVALADLLALNDEMLALSRAGVPLDRGLTELGGELPGQLGAVAGALGARLEAGESLEAALDGVSAGSLPAAYLAVVRAGLRAGRLPVALEGVARAVRRAAQLRQTVGLALIYPTLVLVLAYALMLACLIWWVPEVANFLRAMLLDVPWPVAWLEAVGRAAPWWAAVPPLFLLAGIAASWWRRPAGRASPRRWRREPWGVWGMFHAGRMAGFADVLALLVEHRVPMPEAILLAADASGDRALAAGCRELAERMRRGEHAGGAAVLPGGVPPLLCWLVTASSHSGELSAVLRRLAETYRSRAEEWADWLTMYLPLWLTVSVGGTAVLIYGLVVFAPWCHVLTRLGSS